MHKAALLTIPLMLSGCHRISADKAASSQIVGTWIVKAPEAPFQYHMFVFHSDGTMEQSNPDAGDPNTSDSNGMGVWVLDGDRIRGKFVEVTADRTTRQFASRGEISFSIKIKGKHLQRVGERAVLRRSTRTFERAIIGNPRRRTRFTLVVQVIGTGPRRIGANPAFQPRGPISPFYILIATTRR